MKSKQVDSLLLQSTGKLTEMIKMIKFLGIHLEHFLTWEYHINVSKLFGSSGRNIITFCIVHLAYFALVHTNLSYRIQLCGASTHMAQVLKQKKQYILTAAR